MLELYFEPRGKEKIKLPSVENKQVSMTDYSVPNTQILIVGDEKELSYIAVSKSGITREFGSFREIQSIDCEVLHVFNKPGEKWDMRFQYKTAIGKLFFIRI